MTCSTTCSRSTSIATGGGAPPAASVTFVRRADAAVLDLCCGTGDMTFALYRQAGVGGASIVGADFAHPMLCRATQKSAGLPLQWVEADALQMPFADGRFNLVTSAFGFRNLANYDAGLREIHRVLAADGEVAILDFGEPRGLLGKLYRFYFRRVLPAIGSVLSGTSGPYAYLPASVARFPQPQEMLSLHESRRLPRSQLHALHLRRRRRVLGQEIAPSE